MMWRKFNTYFIWSVMVMMVYGIRAEGLSWEAEVLLSLKKSISVAEGFPDALSNWKNDESGLNSNSHCRWRGVQCDGFNQVVGLNISCMKLNGTLSPEIGKLRNLEILIVSFNNLSGPLPSEITHIHSLIVLNISYNMLEGFFPSKLSNWKELQVLDVYNNNFTGPLPVEVSDLKKLEHLHFGGNYFSGRIPPEYSRIPNLKFLALMGNKLSGIIPRELGNLSKLEQLHLGYDNNYQGGIPPELGKLTNLGHLELKNCGLSGPIPPELGGLTVLHTLYLYMNNLSGPIPKELGNLSSLRVLDLSDNELMGEIPPEFGKLESLTLLNMFGNRLHGIIPSFIAELPNLESLGLYENNFTGEIPQNLGLNGRLLELDLSTNRLTGLLPPYLCKSNKLRTLMVLKNYFFGPIPESLGNCKSLEKVRMGQNFLNGSIPHGFLSLPSVTIIDLYDNYLTGGIPTSISVTRKLGRINLSNNRFGGPLPPAIGNLPGLQSLLLKGNQFSGSIPREISRLKHLCILDFSNNQLSGAIPPEISQCVLLNYLDLSQNYLGDFIPPEITKIPNLNYLNISRNHLVGNIPKKIGGMTSLTSLDLSYNNLSGVVPFSGQFRFFTPTSFAGNPRLCVSNLTSTLCTQSPESYQAPGTTGTRRQPSFSTLMLLLIIGMLFFCTALAIPAIFMARSLWNNTSSTKRWRLTAFQRLHFSCEDILECLKEDNIIGKGGSGVVYRGLMPNGQHVAVKRLTAIGKGSFHDDHGFSAEIKTLGKIRHRHIVKLLCFCTNNEINLLVYEYMANGSLGEMLHGKKGDHLHWDTRYRIALEAAKGLCYLHHDCYPLILHRDVKSNNILLDSNFEAHVADFGLAKFLLDSSASQCMSSIAGSYGYIAPEYAYTLKVDEKSDVYSFGVVLLELISGRRPVGEFGEGVDIVQWVKKATQSTKERVLDVVDRRLSTVPLVEVMHVFYIAMLCVQDESAERPTMREVVYMLTTKFRSNYNLH